MTTFTVILKRIMVRDGHRGGKYSNENGRHWGVSIKISRKSKFNNRIQPNSPSKCADSVDTPAGWLAQCSKKISQNDRWWIALQWPNSANYSNDVLSIFRVSEPFASNQNTKMLSENSRLNSCWFSSFYPVECCVCSTVVCWEMNKKLFKQIFGYFFPMEMQQTVAVVD